MFLVINRLYLDAGTKSFQNENTDVHYMLTSVVFNTDLNVITWYFCVEIEIFQHFYPGQCWILGEQFNVKQSSF